MEVSPILASAPVITPAVDDFHGSASPIRLLIFADAKGPTQEISFLRPLSALRARDAVAIRLFDEKSLDELKAKAGALGAAVFLRRQFEETNPTAVILSRYAGPDYAFILHLAREWRSPVICHLDDNLLDAPPALGLEIWRHLSQPHRVHAYHNIVAEADVLYASTPALGDILSRRVKPKKMICGEIYVGGNPAPHVGPRLESLPRKKPGEIRIGYMGSGSHVHDLEMIRPALLTVLKQYPQTTFHLFGSIAVTSAAKAFQPAVTTIARIRGDYSEFRAALDAMEWDIGLAPLRPLAFNECKAPTKCIEYFEAGCAAIASKGVVYRELGERGAALLASPSEWEGALRTMIEEPTRRAAYVTAGREMLATKFTWTRLERQVLEMLATVCAKARV